MRVAVISDIHANSHALEAVAEAIEQEAPDEIWCLGDLVGYGAAAERVLRLGGRSTQTSAWPATTTSACSGRSTSPTSRPTRPPPREWTRGVLDEPTRATYLATLELERASARASASTTRSPRDPVWEYVLTWEAARRRDRTTRGADVTLVGHSHVPLAIVDGRGVDRRARAGRHRDRPRRRPLAAQPGLGRPAARRRPATRPGCCSTSRRGTPRSGASPYDVARTQAEIREAGYRMRWRSASRTASSAAVLVAAGCGSGRAAAGADRPAARSGSPTQHDCRGADPRGDRGGEPARDPAARSRSTLLSDAEPRVGCLDASSAVSGLRLLLRRRR